jgi:hypothetical protein
MQKNKTILLIGKVEASDSVKDGGELIKYRTPKVLHEINDALLIQDVLKMLKNKQTLKTYGDGELNPFNEIVDSEGEEIHIIQGLHYFEKIVDVVQLKIDEGDIIIDIDSPEKPVDSIYFDDIFFLREKERLGIVTYDDKPSVEVLEYFGKTHANIKITKVRFGFFD